MERPVRDVPIGTGKRRAVRLSCRCDLYHGGNVGAPACSLSNLRRKYVNYRLAARVSRAAIVPLRPRDLLPSIFAKIAPRFHLNFPQRSREKALSQEAEVLRGGAVRWRTLIGGPRLCL